MGKSQIRGRGASDNPKNRFRNLAIKRNVDEKTGACPNQATTFIKDHSGSILASNNSPDIPFQYSINPYRGCEHGCVYCYARPTHEFLGYSSGLDFESKIMVKHKAPQLLEKELSAPGWQPQVIAMSGVTDCYQPVERDYELTRSCIGVLVKFRNPVVIITKNYLVTRDLDLLRKLKRADACKVALSITTLDRGLANKMEPRTSRPGRRLDAIKILADAGIPVSVMIAPVIPGLNDHEIPEILNRASKAGAISAGYVMLRLPYAVKYLFEDWLHINYPNRANKVLNKIKSVRNGELNSSEFGDRMCGTGAVARQVHQLFSIHTNRLGLNRKKRKLSTENFKPVNRQLEFF